MNAIIIEDEQQPLQLLESALSSGFPEIKILSKTDSVLSSISAIKQYQPDIIFMDVVIKGGTAFDIIEEVINLDAEIIFTTSYEKYAVQAFKISAVDYLLKPIDEEELGNAIAKAKQNLNTSSTSSHLNLLLSNFRSQNTEDVKIALPTTKGYSFIKPDQIIRCESDNTYTTFFLTDQREILVSKTLKACEGMLEPYTFCRVHNSSLINLKYIEEYERGEGGIIRMSDGSEVAVSRRRREHFIQLFKDHMP